MSENIPPSDLPNSGSARDSGDSSPPEPETPTSSTSTTRAVRGSPVPTVSSSSSLVPSASLSDPVPDPFDPVSPQASLERLQQQEQLPEIPSSFPAPPLPSPVAAVSSAAAGAAHPSDPAGFEANAEQLASLLELGFEDYTARLALLRTANGGVEAAVQWIVDRSNESDFEDDEEEEAEMGGNLAIPARTHKMVLVSNTSLKMGTGKLAAQVGHATLGVYRQASASEEGRSALEAWRRHGEVKIVVKGESTEQLMDLFKTAKDRGLFCYLVADAGYTQIPAGSRTVLGLFGTVENVDAVTGHLKLL